MPDQFHFIYPLWLWALLPATILLLLVMPSSGSHNPWSKVIDQKLLPLMLSSGSATTSRLPLWLLAIAWVISIIALANPSWEQKPVPVINSSAARVIVLDLSISMFSTDITPSRFARARFKIEDILVLTDDTQTGLVVFAGDAFSVSPLTDDAETIRSLLKALDPRMMPTQGSRADLGLEKALQLLSQAGVSNGDILLIADGFDSSLNEPVARDIRQAGHRLSVLGVATEKGSTFSVNNGSVFKDARGKAVHTRLDAAAMQSLANTGGGIYTAITNNSSDITLLVDQASTNNEKNDDESLSQVQWKEQGPYFVLLLLPLAALAFRRGWLLSMCLVAPLMTLSPPTYALDWNDLWLRGDQQSAREMEAGNFESAIKHATTSRQKGSAYFRSQNYDRSAQAFAESQDAESLYNFGNALAQQKKYQQAIEAWNQALQKQPAMEDALANKASVEAFLKQQQDKQDNGDKQNQDNNNNDQSDDSDNDNSSQQGDDEQDGQSGEQPDQSTQKKGGDDKDSNQFSDANEQLKEGQQNEPDDSDQAKNQNQDNDTKNEQQEATEEAQAEEKKNENSEQRQLSEAEILSQEEQIAAQQWLRRIPDDPGGLLRRKFRYQYQQREQQKKTEQQPW